MTSKERFIEIFKTNIKREGAEELLNFLLSDHSDFFTAPASTRFHGAYEGGLLEHSLNVYDCLCDILARPRMQDVYGIHYSAESAAIVALLHDLCKVNFYKVSFRNAKDESGKCFRVTTKVRHFLTEVTSAGTANIRDTLPL